MAKTNTPTDFNDLANGAGVDEVAKQVTEQLGQAQPPAPTTEGPTLDGALQRYCMTTDGKVYDNYGCKLIPTSRFKGVLGAPMFKQWSESPNRRMIDAADAEASQRDKRKNEGLKEGPVKEAIDRFVYIYPTNDVWDNQRRELVPMTGVKNLLADNFDRWFNSPVRAMVSQDQLVFDPAQKNMPGTINMFRGLPLEPVANPDGCAAISELVEHLCGAESDTYQFLMNWMAYPLQNLGSKMATAILMHSEQHGAGKSFLFDEIMRPIYGEYGCTVGQHQLESQWTEWRSMKLFGLFEEVLSRDQKYSHSGTIKNQITGKSQRIEKKHTSGWEEANYMNAVFLSNEAQPLPVEPSDRRICVIWPREKVPVELRDRMVAELNDGGIQAFFALLLNWPIPKDFGTHTEPPINYAKERLIDFGRASWDTFYMAWKANELPIPYATCLSIDLFHAYENWCRSNKEHCLSHTKFGGLLASRERRKSNERYQQGMRQIKGTFFFVGDNNSRKSKLMYLGECVEQFRAGLAKMSKNADTMPRVDDEPSAR